MPLEVLIAAPVAIPSAVHQPLSPYTTLFRSAANDAAGVHEERAPPGHVAHPVVLVGDAEALRRFGAPVGEAGEVEDERLDRKSTRPNSSHPARSYAAAGYSNEHSIQAGKACQ